MGESARRARTAVGVAHLSHLNQVFIKWGHVRVQQCEFRRSGDRRKRATRERHAALLIIMMFQRFFRQVLAAATAVVPVSFTSRVTRFGF